MVDSLVWIVENVGESLERMEPLMEPSMEQTWSYRARIETIAAYAFVTNDRRQFVAIRSTYNCTLTTLAIVSCHSFVRLHDAYDFSGSQYSKSFAITTPVQYYTRIRTSAVVSNAAALAPNILCKLHGTQA